MPRSMTAYGRTETDTSFGQFTWELRAVNHRYLECFVRLPEELRGLESIVRKTVAERLNRGKIEVGLRWNKSDAAGNAPLVNQSLVQQLADTAKTLADSAPHLAPMSIAEVLKWPGVIEAQDLDKDALTQSCNDAFNAAVDDFIATREREGAALATAIAERAATIKTHVAELRNYRPAVVERQRERLLKRLEELNIDADANRIEQEIVIAASKLDIAEELDRLDAHCDELTRVLARKDAIGRRLDFLMQEFNREANTLGSKAQDSDTTQHAVEIKVLIEQMREQVQNIE